MCLSAKQEVAPRQCCRENAALAVAKGQQLAAAPFDLGITVLSFLCRSHPVPEQNCQSYRDRMPITTKLTGGNGAQRNFRRCSALLCVAQLLNCFMSCGNKSTN